MMKTIILMLGNGLLKKEIAETKMEKAEKKSRLLRKKISVENFLRETLGTHLLEKKF